MADFESKSGLFDFFEAFKAFSGAFLLKTKFFPCIIVSI